MVVHPLITGIATGIGLLTALEPHYGRTNGKGVNAMISR